MEGLSANFEMSASIEELNLSNNKFGEQGSVSLGMWLQSMKEETSLKYLFLSNSGLVTRIVLKVLSNVEKHKQLEYIDLSNNKMDSVDANYLVALAKKTMTIKKFNIAGK